MVKKFTSFRPRLRSRHPSHSVLRPAKKNLPLLPFRSVIRLGSTTDVRDTIDRGGLRVELNTIEAIRNSSNKYRMKSKFTADEVNTPEWWMFDSNSGSFINQTDNTTLSIEELPFPIISKSYFGSRNNGNRKHDDVTSLQSFIDARTTTEGYLFERFRNFSREYRLHVTDEGCFYACRKMLKSDTPDSEKWFRNDMHCIWAMETNEELFDKPINWNAIVTECVKALKAVGLDMGAIDLRVQSATTKDGSVRQDPEFTVIEINSAPSFGEITAKKYITEIPRILRKKANLV